MTNKGNEARCDGNIEIRNESLEQLDQIRVACGNGRCDSGDFEMSSKKIQVERSQEANLYFYRNGKTSIGYNVLT